jgi:hypothetical protein
MTATVRELGVLTLEDAGLAAGDIARIADAIGRPFENWARDCHGVSLAVLRTGIFGRGRIARGMAVGVGSQHSWIVLGDNCYDEDAPVVDPVLWSYRDDVEGIYVGDRDEYGHRPHGDYPCFAGGMPCWHGGELIELTPDTPLKPWAQAFLATLGPLDLHGWAEVAHMGVFGWPAAPIITAMYETPALRALIPIDIVGMLTDKNPGNLYW